MGTGAAPSGAAVPPLRPSTAATNTQARVSIPRAFCPPPAIDAVRTLERRRASPWFFRGGNKNPRGRSDRVRGGSGSDLRRGGTGSRLFGQAGVGFLDFSYGILRTWKVKISLDFIAHAAPQLLCTSSKFIKNFHFWENMTNKVPRRLFVESNISRNILFIFHESFCNFFISV